MEINKKMVRETLERRFSALEIKGLAELLSIPYVEIEGGGLKTEIFEFVEYTDKRGLLGRLWNCMLEIRSDILLSLPKETIESLITDYLTKTSSKSTLVDLGGFAGNFRMKLDLKEIFTPPNITKPIHLFPVIRKLDEYFAEIESAQIRELVDAEGTHLIILGPLGSGKTAILNYLLGETAHNSLRKHEKKLPIYINLVSHINYETKALQVQQLVTEALMNATGIKIDLNILAKLGWQVKILFDHLDELPDRLRRLISVQVEKFLLDNPYCETVLSCSNTQLATQLFDTSKSFYVTKILPLSEKQILDLSNRLYSSMNIESFHLNTSLEQMQNLLVSPELLDWLHTPLEVTTALSCIVSSPTFLPKSITTIVKKKILMLQLSEWAVHKASSVSQIESDSDTFNDTLFFMAYHIYNQGETDQKLIVPLEAGAQYLVNMGIYQSPERARRELLELLGRVNDATELLYTPDLEFSTNYEFRNHTILEVLAATYLFSVPLEARKRIIATKFQEKSWHSIFVLLFDILIYQSITESEQYLDFLINEIATIDKISDSSADELLLIADCLSRGQLYHSNSSDRVKKIVVNVLNDKEQVVSLKNRISLAEYLGEFGDPRIGTEKRIDAGAFWRGYDQYPNDRPARKINLPPFTIDAFPVTNQQYKLFIQRNGYLCEEFWDPDGWKWVQATGRNSPKYWTDPRFSKPNYPVTGVSWFEADAYARWAGKRLPTEAEWEKAARGIASDEKKFYWPWGDWFNGDYLNCSDSTEFIHGTTPIGVYPAGQSSFGVFDMAGNVSEWVADWYEPYAGNSIRDSHYGKRFKVRRGGGWGWDSDFVRCTCRNASPRTADYAVCGFRCCM